jgi:hypothetical protein
MEATMPLDEPVPTLSPAILALTPAEATAKLQEMHNAMHPEPRATPADAQEARARLDVLSRDSKFSRALLAGDVGATKTFNDLVAMSAAGDDAADAAKGVIEPTQPLIEVTVDGGIPRRDVEGMAQTLRESGFDSGSIEQAFRGTAVSVAEASAAEALRTARLSDPAWVERLLHGGYVERRELMLMSTVLSSSIKP